MLQFASGARVSIDKIPGPWKVLEGRGGEREAVTVREAGGMPQVTIPGQFKANEIKTTRLYDAVRDADLARQLDAGQFDAYSPATITETAIDSSGVPIGSAASLPNCVLMKAELSGTDTEEANKFRELTLTWSRSAQ